MRNILLPLQRYNKKCTYASTLTLFLKNNRFYLLNMPFTFMTEACLWEWRVSGIFIRRSRIFQKKCGRAVVWAAWCERTFGGIGKAKAASEGTKNNAHMQGKEQKRMFSVLSGVYWDQNVFFIFNKNDFLKQKYASLALATKIIKKYSKGVLFRSMSDRYTSSIFVLMSYLLSLKQAWTLLIIH